jgi:hypothetical protein
MGKENVTLDVLLDIRSTDWISPHIKGICSDAKDTTYGKYEELEAIVAARSGGKGLSPTDENGVKSEIIGDMGVSGVDGSVEAHEMFLRTVKPFPLLPLNCEGTVDINKPCQCQLELCIGELNCSMYNIYICKI